MYRKISLYTFVFVLLSAWMGFFRIKTIQADKAVDFIDSLSPEQRRLALFPLDDPGRYQWTYIPPSIMGGKGIAMRDLAPVQKEKLKALLHGYLSEKGYAKAETIMSLEEILKQLEPRNVHRIPENYFVSIYGSPHQDSVWCWKFEGHHISLNFTVVKDKISFAPFFFGADPAEVNDGPKKGLRAIIAEEDIALELVNSLTNNQKEKAIFSLKAFFDIVTAYASEVAPLSPVGIAVGDLTREQQQLLRKLIDAYLSSMPEEVAQRRTATILREKIDAVRFGWAGALRKGEPHYYRVQGKSFLIEFDNTQRNANHIHSVWRDFDGDFGRDLLREHYKASHHKK